MVIYVCVVCVCSVCVCVYVGTWQPNTIMLTMLGWFTVILSSCNFWTFGFFSQRHNWLNQKLQFNWRVTKSPKMYIAYFCYTFVTHIEIFSRNLKLHAQLKHSQLKMVICFTGQLELTSQCIWNDQTNYEFRLP